MNKSSKWQPFIYGVLIALGILIGIWLRPGTVGSWGNAGRFKLAEILNLLDQTYVDSIDTKAIESETYNQLLTQLDPHSVYIDAGDVAKANEPLEGNFEGIGVEFTLYNDTIMVVSAIVGGPSEQAGIQAGDRIIKVDSIGVAGIGITTDTVFKKLRGPKGSLVMVTILRLGTTQNINIIRNTIPLHSVEVSMMLDTVTGFIKINRFAANTHQEFIDAFQKLQLQGMKQLVLDLRDNPGGYLTAAIDICDELLAGNKMIVYTKGRKQPLKEYKSTNKGIFEKGSLAVLIDEGSASASEIVSGAVQDWDRGIVVGRRSFGKGLVQEPFELSDGSMVRITVARYYTPSGRSIQKPYDNGYDAYEDEVYHRYEDGELIDSSKVKQADTTKYRTASGRVVFSKGGIMPDVFVPIDTSYRNEYTMRLLEAGLLNQFAFSFVDKNRKRLSSYSNPIDFQKRFTENVTYLFTGFAASKGITANQTLVKEATPYLQKQLKALIARQLWRDMGYFTVINATDPTVQQALKGLNNYRQLLNPTAL